MQKKELVSIVIPCYNHSQYLEEAVQSALNQTYPHIEIIIVNDGSTDDTEKIAMELQSKYPEKIKIIFQKNSGVSRARNSAISQSKGKYILPLDADDIIAEEMVESGLESLISNHADVVYVDTQCFGAKDYLIKKIPFSDNNFLYENLCNATSLFKKRMWKTLGGYAENMKEGYEDWEFWIQAFKKGYKFQLLPEPFLLYRTQEISRNIMAEKKDSYLKAKIMLNHPELYPIEKVDRAENTIRKAENLPDLYFYSQNKSGINKKYLAEAISLYLDSGRLEKQQTIAIPETDKKIYLLSLDEFKDHKQIKKLLHKKTVDQILFFASLRYRVPELRNLDFAWDKNRSIVGISGSIFPYIPKTERESFKSQLLAQRHLSTYQNKQNKIQIDRLTQNFENKIKTVEKQEVRIQDKNRLIKDKDQLIKQLKESIEQKNGLIDQQKRSIEQKNGLVGQQKRFIQQKNGLIEQKNGLIEEKDMQIAKNNKKKEIMMDAIQKVISFSMIKSPIQKYKAYKSLLGTYIELNSPENKEKA